MATLTLDNISKTYPGGVEAVRGLSLEVADGELIVLVGPSGCGKTTTLRMIAGLETVTSGEIRIGDRVVNTLHPKDRDIAMVFQNYALYPHMTVRQNMSFALRMRKTHRNEVEQRVMHAAKMLGIENLLNRKPGVLSGGQQQRVALGRAMVREPAAFLLDEPLSNLDAKLRGTMRAEIKDLQRRTGTTAIHVTHDQEEAMTLGDRIVVMCDGVAQQVGAPMDVYRKPANQFVASFIGQPAMNLIDGRVERSEGKSWFVTKEESARIALPAVWDASIDGEATLGLRPTAFTGLAPSGTASEQSIEVDVRLIEPLGDVMDVICGFAGQSITIRLNASARTPTTGVAMATIDSARMMLFAAGRFGELISNRDA